MVSAMLAKSHTQSWVVTSDKPNIPEHIIEAASASQATLASKFELLRAIDNRLTVSNLPAASDRWIASGIRDSDIGSCQRGESAETERAANQNRHCSGSNSANLRESSHVRVDDLTALGAMDLLAGYAAGSFSPVEVLDACLARIDELDSHIGAVVARNDEAARAQAVQATKNWQEGTAGPLEGVPVGVKDIIDTAGLRTEAGSPLLAGHVPTQDATAVARLRRAGALIVAKTTTPEFAFGDQCGSPTTNPAAPRRWAGGSSVGSAAGLAARLFPLALGTDTGGSIRVPASYCGVTGLKPTFGRVPRDAVFGVSWTLDHVGPMARNTSDLAAMLAVIAGHNASDPYSSRSGGRNLQPVWQPMGDLPLRELKVGVATGWLSERCSTSTDAAIERAATGLEQLGATTRQVRVPHSELAGVVAWVITVTEFAAHHRANLGRIAEFTPSAAHRLAAGATIRADDYLRALCTRSLIQRDIGTIFDKVDVLLTAATPTTAPDPVTFFDDGDRLWLDKVARCLLPFNVTGQPALVMPVGNNESRPTAIQIVGPPRGDMLCLRVASALEASLGQDR